MFKYSTIILMVNGLLLLTMDTYNSSPIMYWALGMLSGLAIAALAIVSIHNTKNMIILKNESRKVHQPLTPR